MAMTWGTKGHMGIHERSHAVLLGFSSGSFSSELRDEVTWDTVDFKVDSSCSRQKPLEEKSLDR